MRRTPEEWLQFAIKNERQDDPVIRAGWVEDGQWLVSAQALGHLCEAVRAEALDQAEEVVSVETVGTWAHETISRLRDED